MEDLVYRRLLDWYYLHECPIPHDLNEVSRQIRMRSHSGCIADVLQEYFERTDDGWIHHRADKEIAKAGDKSEKASASAKARWSKRDANALRTQSEGNATQDTIPITQDTKHKTQKKEPVVQAPEGVSPEVWDSFVKQRKASRAVITESVLKTIAFEAEKAKWTLEQALAECAARGWRGFKADWVMPKPNPADIVRLTVPPSNEPDPALEKIKADEKKAAPIPDSVREYFAKNRRQA